MPYEVSAPLRGVAEDSVLPSADNDRADATRAKISSFVGGFDGSDSFYDYILERIGLENRQCPTIEKRSNEDFETWLSKTFRDVNDGKHPGCSIANVIHVDVSVDDHDLELPECVAEVIDTKGLDSAAAARMDLQELMRAEDTVCFVMDDVKSVPSDNVRSLLKRTYLNELDVYYKSKTSVFVRSPDDELAGVNGADGDSEVGADLKESEIHRRVDADGIPYFVENTVFLDSCAAYIMNTTREPVLDASGQPVINQRTNRPKYKSVTVIAGYDDEAAEEYRDALTEQVGRLVRRLRDRLGSDALEARDGVARLLEIERRTASYAAMMELRGARETIEEGRGSLLHRFRRREASEAVLKMAIDDIHWATIRKMNSLYGGYEMWHTDIYTQIQQAGRECFANLMKPISNHVHRTLGSLQNKEAQSIALGYLSQFDLMVNDATDGMGDKFLGWVLEDGFAPQDDSNRLWLDVNHLRGRGYKRMVRDAYVRHIDDDTDFLAEMVNTEANGVVDGLLRLISEGQDEG